MEGVLNTPYTLSQLAEMKEQQVGGNEKVKGAGRKVINFISDENFSTRAGREGAGTSMVPMLDAPGQTAGDIEDIAASLEQLQIVAQDNRVKEAKNDIKDAAKRKKELFEERLEKIKQARAAMQKAKKWGVFAKVVGWIALAATIVVGAALIVAGIFDGGTTAIIGVGLIAAGLAIGVTLQVSSLTGNWLEKGEEWVAEKMGADAKTAHWIAFGINLTLGIASGLLMLGGGGVVSLGAKAAAETTNVVVDIEMESVNLTEELTEGTVEAMSEVTEEIEDPLSALEEGGEFELEGDELEVEEPVEEEEVPENQEEKDESTKLKKERLEKVIKGINRVDAMQQGVQGGLSVTAKIGVAINENISQKDQADAKKTSAFILELQNDMDQQARALKKILDEIQEGISIVASILSGQQDIKTQIIKNIGA